MSTRVLVAACLAQLMITLDVSVVNVALPVVRTDLGLGAVGQQWVVTAYALPFAGFLLVGGRVADLTGIRVAFVGGMGLFVVGSVVAGGAPGPEMLLAGRATQGLAAAFLAPATLTALTVTFEEGEPRTRAMAWWTAMSIAGGAVGSLCGGILTDLFGWRSTLLVNLPLGAAAVGLAIRGLPADRKATGLRSLNFHTAALASSGLLVSAVGLGMLAGRRWALGVAVLAVGWALFVAFIHSDRAAARPVVPRGLFAVDSVKWGNIGLLLVGGALVPMWFFLTLQLQEVLGYSPLVAGLAFLPHTVIQLVVSLRCTPRLMRWVQPSGLVAAGAVLLVLGFAWQSRLGPESDYATAVLLPAILIASGSGLLNLPLTAMTVSGVERSEAGAASGIMNCAKQIGGGLGLALLVALTAAIHDPAQAYGAAFALMAVVAAVVGVGALLVRGRLN